MELTLTITKRHQKQYDYDFYEVQEQGSRRKFIGMKEDVLAEAEKLLEAMKGEENEDA